MYLVENCCGTQGAQPGAELEEWDGGGVGVGRRFKKKGTYVYV